MIAKRDEERVILRESGRRHARILAALRDLTVPGVSTQELEDAARRMIAEGGDTAAFLGYKPHGARRPYPAALCVSINDAIVHGIPNEHPIILADGDIVKLDVGVRHQGLITDAAITVVVGKGTDQDYLLQRAAEEALARGIAQALPGNTMGDIGAAIEAVGRKYGFGSPYELGGHSVGRSVHEEPLVPNFGRPGKGKKLEEGLVLAIEPMFTLGSSDIVLDPDGYTYRTADGSRSSHAEHTILITQDGPEILTTA